MQQAVVSARALALLVKVLSQERVQWQATKPCSVAPMGREAETMPARKPMSHILEPVQTNHRRARVLAKMPGASPQTHGDNRPIHGVATTTKALLQVLEAREATAKAAVDCSTCSATSLETTEPLQFYGKGVPLQSKREKSNHVD